MDSVISQLYQLIGTQALELASDLAGRLLVYAEVEEGVVSADIFYVNAPSGPVRYRFCPAPMLAIIKEFWKEWKNLPGNSEWRTLAYIIDGGNFSVDFTYPNQVNEDEDPMARRASVVQKYFGNATIDYSKP